MASHYIQKAIFVALFTFKNKKRSDGFKKTGGSMGKKFQWETQVKR